MSEDNGKERLYSTCGEKAYEQAKAMGLRWAAGRLCQLGKKRQMSYPFEKDQLLSGTSVQGFWKFATTDGRYPDKPDAIFQIMRQDLQRNNEMTLLGTGFYISADGLF